MGLASGTRIGHYEIRQAIGAGGMGEVYRARDTKLGRDVALKILPQTFATDPERLARFQREATTLASLNHPHIAQIYGIEESGPTRALIMELVEGEDLAERLARRPLSLTDALPIARQIAEALATAHEAGIVHRDLKPANIRLRADGEVKVLDFGLAKSAAVSDEANPHLVTETLTSPAVTHAGVILGTAAYMAPEQAQGRTVDRRVDIWAFGCVVFEMLAGRRAFPGETVTDVFASVLAREPGWKALPSQTPDSIHRLLRRCLQKDPKRRLREIGDACLDLDDALEAPPPKAKSRGPTPRWVLGLGTFLIAGLGGALLWFTMSPEPARAVVRTQRLTDMIGLEEAPALSPDGRSLAFTAGVNGKRQVFIQLLNGGEPLQITHDDADHQFPRWTPSSASVVYFSPATAGGSQGMLSEISALGGQPRRLASSLGAGDVRGSDSLLTYFRNSQGKPELVTAPLDGSSITVVASFELDREYLYPRWSPDGKWIAYQQGAGNTWDIHIVPADGGKLRKLTNDARHINGFAWLPDSSGLLYSSTRGETMAYLPTARLWHVALAGGDVWQATSGEASYAQPDIARNGAVVVSSVHMSSDIWKFPTDGPPPANMQKALRLTNQTGLVQTPTPSPDDREVAFLSDRGGHANIWVLNLESRVLRQITHERDPKVVIGLPTWSPTTATIAFVSSRDAAPTEFGIWLVNADGSNNRKLVTPGIAPVWSADGRSLYYSVPMTNPNAAARGLFKITEGGTAVRVRADEFRNTIGSTDKTQYFQRRRLMDGLPALEISEASPEDGPARLIARVSPSRVPLWQLFNPTLSPDGTEIAQALTDGFTTNIWTLSTSTATWRQITDFAGRPTFIARRVSWSSDGRSVLAAVAEGDADIVLLDGVLKTGRD